LELIEFVEFAFFSHSKLKQDPLSFCPCHITLLLLSPNHSPSASSATRSAQKHTVNSMSTASGGRNNARMEDPTQCMLLPADVQFTATSNQRDNHNLNKLIFARMELRIPPNNRSK
jgi:hypothetical protein